MSTDTILLIAAFICFLLDALKPILNLTISINLTALGLALWVLTALI